MYTNAILEILRQDENAIPYPDGSLPSTRFAVFILRLPPVSPERKEIQKRLVEIAENIESISAKEIASLLNFIHSAGIPSSELDDFSKSLSAKKIEDVASRAEVMRFLAKGNFISLAVIMADQEVQEKEFWKWIDAVSKKNWPLTVQCVYEHLRYPNNQDTVNLLGRLPAWRKKQTLEELSTATAAWLMLLEGENKEKLSRGLNLLKKHY